MADGRKSLKIVPRSLIETNKRDDERKQCRVDLWASVDALCTVVNFLRFAFHCLCDRYRKEVWFRFAFVVKWECVTLETIPMHSVFLPLIHFSVATNINSTLHSDKRRYFEQFYSYFLRFFARFVCLLCVCVLARVALLHRFGKTALDFGRIVFTHMHCILPSPKVAATKHPENGIGYKNSSFKIFGLELYAPLFCCCLSFFLYIVSNASIILPFYVFSNFIVKN